MEGIEDLHQKTYQDWMSDRISQNSTFDIDVLELHQLEQVFTEASKEVLLVAPFFVPGDIGYQFLKNVREKKISVEVITNALSANSRKASHAAYQQYRKKLLDLDIALLEVKSVEAEQTLVDTLVNKNDTVVAKKISKGRIKKTAKIKVLGVGDTHNHSKVFIVDSRYIFIGSLNLEDVEGKLSMQSATGMLIESPSLAQVLQTDIKA